jgi:hypothetical protein
MSHFYENLLSLHNANERYRVLLCKQSREVIAELTSFYLDETYEGQLGGADSFSFSVLEKVNGMATPEFEKILPKQLLRIYRGSVDLGFFEIQECSTEHNITARKNIRASSLEIKLSSKKFFLTEGVFTLDEILDAVAEKSKGWKKGFITPSLRNRSRLIDLADTTVLEFLLSTAQGLYECIFIFNTVTRTISAYALANFGINTEIFISHKNLASSLQVEDLTGQIVTRLYLYGNSDMSVREVNMGQDFIENFSFFKNSDWMSVGLITALNAYENTITAAKPNYDALEVQRLPIALEINALDAEIVSIKHNIQTKTAARDKIVASGEYYDPMVATLTQEIRNFEASLITKTAELDTKKTNLISISSQMNAIADSLDKSLHFTVAQLEELDAFIFEEMYQDDSFVLSDRHDYEEYRAAQTELLNFGKARMQEICYPRLSVDLTVADFLSIKEFSHWGKDFKLGDYCWVNWGDNNVKLRISGYSHSFSSRSFSITLADKAALDDSTFQMLEMLQAAVSSASTISFERFKYKDYVNNDKNDILSFLNNSLDLSLKNIVGNNSQMVIDDSGILMRRDKDGGGFEPQQIRIGSNGIIFTKDGFDTINMAIGQIGTGANAQFGVAADMLIGKVILGTNLQIESGNQKTLIDENGITVRSTNDLQQILLKADTGIKIQTRPNAGVGWTDKFYVDGSGNLTFTGELIGSNMTNGSIVGSTINIGNGKFVVDSAGNLTSQTLNSSLSVLSDEINLKVSGSEFTSTITQLSDEINLKVSGSEFTSTITQLSDEINLKVSGSEFTSTITQLSNSISAKISASDVTAELVVSAINGGTVTIEAKNINLNGAVIVNGTLTGGEIRGGVFKTQSGLGGGFVMANHGTNLVDYQFLGSPGPLVPIFEIRDDVSSTTINCHGTPRMGFNSSGSSTLSGYWTMGGLDIVTQRGTGSGLQIAATNLGIVIWEGGLMKGQFLYGGNTATFG